MRTHIYKLITLLLIFVSLNSFGQDRFLEIENKLEDLAEEVPGLNEKVELSVNDVSIQEFVRGIAMTNKINISIDPSLNFTIINNFSNVTVNDVLLFLCRKYDLDITFIGNIISISKYIPAQKEKPAYVPKEISISYKNDSLLSIDLRGDSLYRVVKKLTMITGKNVILAPGLDDRVLNGYIQEMPFENAIDKMTLANDLQVTKTEDNFYLIEQRAKTQEIKEDLNNKQNKKGQKNGQNKKDNNGTSSELVFTATDVNNISVNTENTEISNIIKDISEELKINYFIFSEIQGNITVSLENISYEELLDYLLNGTKYTYKKENNIYLIGERQLEGLRETKVLQLQHRTVEKIMEFIPSELKKDLEIKEFSELNSLILSGSSPMIRELERFIRNIDQVVPVVLIEVLIIDVSKGRSTSTGIKAGIGNEPGKSGGGIFPDVNYNLNATSMNNLINSFNGFGLLNLGAVTPNFYLQIKALESQGYLKLRSTPKLATLNGHEATMSIGNTAYYLEESNNVIGSQNPQNIITRQYKSVKADMSLSIKPIVSGDDQITLEIKVDQSDFTARISPDAPPGTVSRNFSSFIRVKNEEMVLLGGLEEKSINDSGSGIPILSRIPVLKWLFSNKTRENKKNKLNIFIKPVIVY